MVSTCCRANTSTKRNAERHDTERHDTDRQARRSHHRDRHRSELVHSPAADRERRSRMRFLLIESELWLSPIREPAGPPIGPSRSSC
jgi:hypothetical protein